MIHLGDITKLRGDEIPPVDCITGGSPCQDLSVAGKRAGLEGERSGLFMEQIRIVKEMRERDIRNGRTGYLVRPRYMVWENVPGAFSSNKGADFQAVLTGIVKIVEPDAPDVPLPDKGKWPKAGCLYSDVGKWSVAWRVHDAQFWGVPQRRKRIALVADFGGLAAPEILFERESLSRDPEPRGAEGQGTAAAAGNGTKSASGCLNGWDVQSKHVQPRDGVAEALYAGECRYGGGESYVMDGVEASGVVSKGNGEAFLMREKTSSLTIGGGQAGQGYPCVMETARTVGGGVDSTGWGWHNGTYYMDADIEADPTIRQQGDCIDSTYPTVARSLTQRYDGSPCIDRGPDVVVQNIDSVFCLQGNGIDRADTAGCNGKGWREDQSYTLNTVDRPAVYIPNVANTLSARHDGSPQPDKGNGANIVAVHQNASGEVRENDVAYTIGTNANASGRNTPLVYDARGNGNGETVPTLTGDHQNRVTDYTALCVGGNQVNALCMDVGFFSTEEEKSGALLARQYKDPPIVVKEEQQTVGTLCAESYPGKLAHQDVISGLYPLSASVIRRLTPLECERLQGFPDGWTDIGDWVDTKGKRHKAADSPRYKALGNSIALPFWFWLLRRISAQYERPATLGSLFDGIGGFPLCWERCNGKGTAIWASEIEEFPIAVTKAHFPEVGAT